MIVRDPDGTAVLTLGDIAPVDGYLVTAYDEGGRTWRRTTTESLFVDGEFELTAALGGRTLTLSVYIAAADWDAVTVKHNALIEAVETPGWQLQVGSVVWTCRVADSASPMPPAGNLADYREVTLTIPASQRLGI